MKKIRLIFVIFAFIAWFGPFFYASADVDYEGLERLTSGLENWDYADPYVYFQPVSNTSWFSNNGKSGFKYYCQGTLNLNVNTVGHYDAVGVTIKYDPELGTVNGGGVSSSCTALSVFTGVLSNAYRAICVGSNMSATTYGNLRFTPSVNDGNSNIWFDICDKDLNNCTNNFRFTTNSDQVLYYIPLGDSLNALKGVKGAIYDLYAWPCTPDTKKPVISSILNNKVYSGIQNLTGLIYDYDASNVWHYWFNGHNYSETGLNYVYVNTGIDNQQGIDERTINVSISCPDCNWSQTTQSLTATKSRNSGRSDRNVKTWNNNDRGYLLSFTTPRLELERQTTVTISGCDIRNETGVNHCETQTFTFNKSTNPNVTGMYNTNGTQWRTDNVFPSMTNEYMITVSDNPAGINPSSITITFNEATDLSGNTTPTYVLSGNELSISESGTLTDYGVRTIYEVRFHPPYDLLEGTQTKMTVYVEDYVGNTGSKVFNLNTRGACSSFGGCRDYLNINHFGEDDIVKLFSGLNIVVTGIDINSIYPYLTGDTLFCGSPWTGAVLSPEGKMNLYKRGDGSVQSGLALTTPNQHISKAENSDDLDYDTNKTSDSRSLVNRIDVK